MIILNIHLLILGFSLNAGQSAVGFPDAIASKLNATIPQTTTDVQDQDDPILDPEYLVRKLDQQKLEPLSKKEKIIWSFKMSETDLFL